MKAIKIILLLLVILVLLAILAGLALGIYRTIHSYRSPAQAEFKAGSIPAPMPDGFYPGSVAGYHGSWAGKKFDRNADRGINIFGSSERYPFKTYVSQGATDSNIETFKIDYNVSGNPLWLRLLLDEMVQTAPGEYLGKIQLRLIPKAPFTLGYFRLRSNN